MTGSKAGSKPEHRMRLLEVLETFPAGHVVKGENIEELRTVCGMEDVSNTQFSKALRSLCYHYRVIRIHRPHALSRHFGPRIFEVSYIPTLDVNVIPKVAVA
jgi:hypothetical protein